MKKVLIMVISCEQSPYDKLINTSLTTWDSIDIDGVETIYYCGKSDIKDDHIINKSLVKHFPIEDCLYNMGYKDLLAYNYALIHRKFDYVARVNSSCYVDKKQLIEYVLTLPDKDVFEGLVVAEEIQWMFGGGQFLISRDVLQKFVDNKDLWDHSEMEDKSMSFLATKLGIPFRNGNACSIDKQVDGGWLQLCYGRGKNTTFVDFNDVKDNGGHYFYRVKNDADRNVDHYVMNELFKSLNQ